MPIQLQGGYFHREKKHNDHETTITSKGEGFLGRTDLQGEHGSLSKQGPLPDRMLPYIGKKNPS